MTTELDLKLAAAEYAAGELSSAECSAFEAHLRADPELAREVAFWRNLRTGLAPQPTVPAETAPRCPDLSGTLLRRARLERATVPARRLQLPRWVMVATAAAACLALGLGFGAGAAWSHRDTGRLVAVVTPSTKAPIDALIDAPIDGPTNESVSEIAVSEPLAYGEDGSAMTPPPATVTWRTYLPLAAIESADANHPLAMSAVEKPWIGLWTKQAKLVISGAPAREAHLVVRIVGGSPAWLAGLRPGDMIIAIDDCPISSPLCLGEHLAGTVPGSKVKLDYWSANDAALRTTTVTLETIYE